jgi:hypothetical protein
LSTEPRSYERNPTRVETSDPEHQQEQNLPSPITRYASSSMRAKALSFDGQLIWFINGRPQDPHRGRSAEPRSHERTPTRTDTLASECRRCQNFLPRSQGMLYPQSTQRLSADLVHRQLTLRQACLKTSIKHLCCQVFASTVFVSTLHTRTLGAHRHLGPATRMFTH